MEIENPMVVDAYWHDYDEDEKREEELEAWYKKIDEEYDGRFD